MSPAPLRAGLVPIAKVTKTHGLRGEVRARPLGGASDNLGKLKSVFLRKDGGDAACEIERSRPSKSFHILKLAGVDSVEQARELVGRDLLAPEQSLAKLAPGEYYWYQLVGLRVLTGDGRDMGAVESLFATGANDVLVVRQGARERFLPYTDDAVASIDLENGLLILSGQEGLEDL